MKIAESIRDLLAGAGRGALAALGGGLVAVGFLGITYFGALPLTALTALGFGGSIIGILGGIGSVAFSGNSALDASFESDAGKTLRGIVGGVLSLALMGALSFFGVTKMREGMRDDLREKKIEVSYRSFLASNASVKDDFTASTKARKETTATWPRPVSSVELKA